MSSSLLAASKKMWAVFCTLSMCIAVGMTTNHIAMADSATQNSNIIASLKYMSELNKLRQSRRTALTAQQIIEAQNADNSANMRSGQVAEDAADGSPVPELNVNWDLMSWAQKRADALAERASVNQSQPISHDDMYVGAPSWTSKYNLGESPNYQSGTYWFGPEALFIGYPETGQSNHNPIQSWYSELSAPAGSSRQGYGHYLTEVSNLADTAGMASAQVTSGRWEGATIVVLEIGYTGNHSDRGTTQSVSDALKQYVGSTYTVKYHANGGNGSMDDQKFDMDSTIPLYGNRFTRTGYQFSGWNTKKDGSGTQYSDYNPIYNIANAGEVVDLYAQWTPNTYTVYFYSGGTGSGGGSSRSFTYDQAQNLPNPADVGISNINGTFTSWNTEYDGSGTSYQAGQSVKNLTADEYGSIYLYAQWKATHTVHFRAYNATPEYFDDQQVADGDSATKPTDPVRPGFVFRGWATSNSDDSPLYDFSAPVTEDVWLYALWDSYPYTIRYDANGGTGTMPDQKVASDPSVNTATLKSNEFNYNGRVFTGWNTKRDGTGTAYKENTSYAELNITAANQIITLYAQWTTAKVKTIDAVTVKCNYSACYPVLPNEVKIHLSDGSTVEENVDWNKDQLDAIIDKGQSGLHLSDVFYIDSTSIVGFPNQRIRAKIVASDTTAPSLQGLDTVAARINDTSFDTMYGINAIDNNDGDVTRNIKVSGNFDISKTGDYQLTYTVKDAAGNEATGNRTIHVTDDNIATITFNPNGGIGSMSPQTVTTDGSYQIFRSTKFTRVHYNLESWNTKADGSGKRYNAYGDWLENSDVPSNGKITLYAQWEHATYTVMFYPNLPNDSGIGIVNSQNIKYDEYEKLAGNTCMDPGYTFIGWNTEKDGSGTSYSDEQQVKNIYDKYGYSITLYAQWKANKYTVQFNANGGTGTMPSQTLTYDKNERLNRSTFKAPAGKMITGWNTKADGTGTGYDYCAPVKNLLTSGSITLYAWYSPIRYSSISVQTPPKKASYKTGETLDTTGLVVSAIQNNGDTVQLPRSEYTLSQPNMNSNGTKRVTLTLKSNTAKTTWFDITVGSAAPTVEESHSIADSDETVTNYVVSLKEGTATDVLDKAVTGAEALHAYKLMSYPEISVFFVQAHTKTFASDFARWAAANGIAVDTVAYTRDKLREEEIRYGNTTSSDIATTTKWKSGNAIRKPQKDSSDPNTNIYDAWGITAIGADKAQRTNVAYKPTLTGVIDSGIEDDNPDLQGQVSSTYSVDCTVNGIPQQGTDSSTGRPVWWPTAGDYDDMHGTHVSGTIAASHNGSGVDGVNPNTTLAAIRVLKHDRTYLEQEVCGYVWAAKVGMDVTNASIGSLSPDYPDKYAVDKAYDTVLQRAVSYATKSNVVNVASAGNNKLDIDNIHDDTSLDRMRRQIEKRQPREVIGQAIDASNNENTFNPLTGLANQQSQGLGGSGLSLASNKGYIVPAMLDGVLAVSAVQKRGTYSVAPLSRANYSNYGSSSIDVAAPGSNVYSTYGTNYAYMSGTSMASPHVAGVASLLKSVHPNYSASQITQLLKKHAKELYGNLEAPTEGLEYRGAGLVNAYASMTEDQEKPAVSAQYSADGGSSWHNLANAIISGKATIRMTATGPVSSASVNVAGQNRSTRGNDSYNGNASITVDVDFSTLTAVEAHSMTIKAYGLNYDVSNDDVSKTIQFQAGHTAYATVAFDSNGGSTVASQSVRYGSKATQPTNPTRTGYTFQGWYTAKNGGTKYDFSQTVTSGITLYAHWSVNSYILTFDGNSGETSESSRTVQYGSQYGGLPTATRTGYIFQGWYTAKDNGSQVSSSTTMGAANTTVYAHWTIRTYTVTFDSNGGSSVAAQKVKYGSRVTEPANPARIGYTFQGWYTAKNSGTKYDFNQTVTSDVTLHAHWAKEPAALRRLAGATRYDTMEEIVGTGGWKSGGTVIVASGGNYPDALAASGLAGTLDAPIVLTDGKTLSFQAFTRLTDLAPSRIIVAGGRAAVSDGVMDELEDICPHVERVAGATRVDTSLNLYRKGSGWGSTAILATASNFADALSISSYAYAAKAPVFLVDSNALTNSQQIALSTGQFSRIVVVGGINAVSERVATKAQSITGAQLTRLSGATRYETSERIARWTTGHGLGMNGVAYATGANFPDALAAGPLAGKAKAATLLVEDAHSPAVSFSAEYRGKVDNAYVVGGVNAVSQATANAIADSLGLKHAQ